MSTVAKLKKYSKNLILKGGLSPSKAPKNLTRGLCPPWAPRDYNPDCQVYLEEDIKQLVFCQTY